MKHKFVGFMPEYLEEGTVYISFEYGSVIHLCACGCGEEVNTPLSPTGWKLTYDGKNISLDPSIGNWSFDCRSHYWIRNSKVIWAENWSDSQVKNKREYDIENTNKYFENQNNESEDIPKQTVPDSFFNRNIKISLWKRIMDFLK